MDANDRRVDHSNVPVVGFCDHVHQAVPHAGLPPAIEAIVDGRWRPITLRQVGPPSSRPQYPKNAVQYPAIIDPRHTARLIRQTRLDRLPLGIRQLIAAHRKPPVWELESRLARAGNPRTRFMSLRPSSVTVIQLPRLICSRSPVGRLSRSVIYSFPSSQWKTPATRASASGCGGSVF